MIARPRFFTMPLHLTRLEMKILAVLGAVIVLGLIGLAVL